MLDPASDPPPVPDPEPAADPPPDPEPAADPPPDPAADPPPDPAPDPPPDPAPDPGPDGLACRKSSTCSNFFDTHTAWPLVVARAEVQRGVITTGELRDLGMSKATIAAYVRSGRLHRIHHGVYALTPATLLTPHGRLMAAVLACGPLAALSFAPAARLHGLLNHRTAQPHVTLPSGNGRSRTGIRIHRSRTLRVDLDVTVVDGIPCTTVHRTIFDLAGVLTPRQLERLLDQALTLDLLDMNAVADQIAQNRGRQRNVSALRTVLAEHAVGSTVTWNDFEERFLALVRAAGLPAPEVQVWLDLRDGELPIRLDFLWREQRVIVEADGWQTHGGRASFERDRRRDQRAAAAGYRTIRATWRQLDREPARLRRTLVAVTASAPGTCAA